MAYSIETLRPLVSAYFQDASRTCLIGYRSLIGTSVSLNSSVGACKLTANLTGNPSAARSLILGTSPTVLTVIFRALIPNPSGDSSWMR